MSVSTLDWADDWKAARWGGCLLLVLALHAGVVEALLRVVPAAPPVLPEAIMLELEPAPAASAPEEAPPIPAEPAPPEPAAEQTPPPPPVEAPPPEPTPPKPTPPEPTPPEPPPPEPPPPPAPVRAEAVPVPVPRRPPPPPRRPAPPRPTVAPAEAAPAPAAAPAAAVPGPPAPSQSVANPAAVSSWQGALLARLQAFRRYPDAARSRREEGVVLLTFSMDREGHVLGARIARGSGFTELDGETLALVRRAEPLPVPPADMPGNPLTLTVPVRFSLR